MTDLLKKYRFNISALLVLTVLLFFFLPNEKSSYLTPDFEAVKQQSQIVLLWAETIFLVLLFFYALKKIKKLSGIFYLIVGLGFFGLTFFFLFDSIFLSTTLLLNKLSKKETVYKTYQVLYVNAKRNLLLWDNEMKTNVEASQLIKTTNHLNLKAADTVVLSFTKGLLGFKFNPTIK